MRTTLTVMLLLLAAVSLPACSTTYRDAMDSYTLQPAEALERQLQLASERRQSGARDLRAIARRARGEAPINAHALSVDAALIEAHRYDAAKDLASILDAAMRVRGVEADNEDLEQFRRTYERLNVALTDAGLAMQRLQNAVESGDSSSKARLVAAEASEPVSRASSALAAAAAAGNALAGTRSAAATEAD